MKLTAVVVVLVCVSRTEGLWENRKVHCGVSVWAKWGPWSAPAPGGNRSRNRTIIREPKRGGRTCPSLTDSENRQDPWSDARVSVKLQNNVLSGHTTYYRFVQRTVNIVVEQNISLPDNVAQASQDSSGGDVLTLLPRDILFLVDMSGSISSSEWNSTKHTLVKLIKKICGTIGEGNANNRIAIITFSSTVVLNFDFKTHWTIDSVSRAILGMNQTRRTTCTGDAFEYAHTYMFDPSKGIRSATESVKEVLVLTDGHSNCGAKLADKVQQLQVKAFVYALAIGNYGTHGKAEIESMVSRPLIDHIFSVANFIQFKAMVDEIYRNALFANTCATLELK